VLWLLGAGWPALVDPPLARAVQELDVVVAVVLEVPVRVGGKPVVAIAVKDHQVVVADSAAAEQLSELLRAEEIALDLILQIGAPIEPDCPRDVPLPIERRVLVHLDDADRVVFEVLLEPLGLDEHVTGVVGHTFS
jgi:hypothetical protein